MSTASSPPARDGEVCGVRSPNSEDGYCPCVSPAGHLDPHRCLHGSRWIRPAAPSEPPAADSPTPGTHRPFWLPLAWGGIAAGCQDCRWTCAGATDGVHRAIADHASGRAGAGEQQREQVARWLFAHDGSTPSAWDRLLNDAGKRVWLRYADELLSLLGGPQPDGDARQHRMDADCWCQPVQADNGAWDHNDGPTAPEPATPAPNA